MDETPPGGLDPEQTTEEVLAGMRPTGSDDPVPKFDETVKAYDERVEEVREGLADAIEKEKLRSSPVMKVFNNLLGKIVAITVVFYLLAWFGPWLPWSGQEGDLEAEALLRLIPLASAPETCDIGDQYIDISGAYCFCTSTDRWENTLTTGSCGDIELFYDDELAERYIDVDERFDRLTEAVERLVAGSSLPDSCIVGQFHPTPQVYWKEGLRPTHVCIEPNVWRELAP